VESTFSPHIHIHFGGNVKTISLSEQTIWTFGRSKETTVQIKDQTASRVHAQLEIHRKDQYYFVDLGSTNGTLINDEPLTQPRYLKHGDRISIGNTLLVFKQAFDPDSEEPSSFPGKQVLMLYSSTAQAAFWQAIFDFRNVPTLKAETLESFKDQIELIETSDTAPNVCLIDAQAYRGDCYKLCLWLQQKHPNYKIFLTDGKRKTVSSLERQLAIKSGALNHLPAMTRRDLVLNNIEVLGQANEVLKALECKLIEKEELLYLLRMNKSLKDWYFTDKTAPI
jgi:pSer/pThr/pTyr-binding forkhead associated (FHA) protein